MEDLGTLFVPELASEYDYRANVGGTAAIIPSHDHMSLVELRWPAGWLALGSSLGLEKVVLLDEPHDLFINTLFLFHSIWGAFVCQGDRQLLHFDRKQRGDEPYKGGMNDWFAWIALVGKRKEGRKKDTRVLWGSSIV